MNAVHRLNVGGSDLKKKSNFFKKKILFLSIWSKI